MGGTMLPRPLAIPLSLLLLTAAARAVDAEGVTEDKTVRSLKPAARTAVTAPADSAEAAKKGFRRAKIPAGFKAGLWASEPLLANPVAFSFDGKGRMFIAETHRYRTSVLDIRHYMFMLEDDLANRNQADWERSIKKSFPNDWQELGKESEVVRLVEDTNGDGTADKSSVYADGFNSILDGIASGVLARPDGVWVTNIPGLYKLSGQGADGKAKKKEEVFRGFGVRFNYTGHDLHGLIKGPDGRLYFSIGDRGASVKTKEGGTIEVPDEGAIFRCEEDGSHLELVMRGLRNPQELAFDDYGNLFTCDNDSDQGDRERLVYVVEGGDAGWRVGYQHCPQPAERNPWLAEHMWEPRDPAKNQPASILSPIANLPDGPGGLVHYPGTGLPEKYNGCFFLACYKGSSLTSQVAVFKPVPDGAGFKLEMLETFIPGCQATDVDFGPDSRMYVSFWDEGWERTAQGRIMKVEHEEARKAQASEIEVVQRLLASGLMGVSTDTLVECLCDKDQRLRLESQWELVRRATTTQIGSPSPHPDGIGISVNALNALKAISLDDELSQQTGRLHAIWGLGHYLRAKQQLTKTRGLARTLNVDEKDLVRFDGLFNDKNEEVRAAWLRFQIDVGLPFDETMSLRCAGKLSDSSARVRLAAAQALGKLGSHKAAAPLLQMLKENRGYDQYLSHAGVHALVRILSRGLPVAQNESDTASILENAYKYGDATLRRFIVVAAANALRDLGQKPDAAGGYLGSWEFDLETVLSQAIACPDESVAREAIRLVNLYGLRPQLLELADLAAPEKLLNLHETMSALRALTAAFTRGTSNDATNLLAFGGDESRSAPLRMEAFRLLSLWADRPQRDQVTGLHQPHEGRDKSIAATAVAYASRTLGDDWLLDFPDDVGIAALHAVAQIGDYRAVSTLNPVIELSSSNVMSAAALRSADALGLPQTREWAAKLILSESSTVRIAAAGLLGKTDPAAAAKALESALAQGTAEDARAAFTELAALTGAEADRIVVEQLTALTAGKVPAIARLELLEASAKREAPAVKEALSKYEASLPKDDVLAKFATCLEGGDAVKGQTVFKSHAVAACTRCHIVNKSGGEAGPALDGIASRKDRRYLLESILLPNAQIAESFRMVVCNMKDGSVKSGVLRAETADSVTIQSPGEEPETLKTADIASRDAVPSAMLPGMDVLLTKRELRDLVEYVASLRE